MKKIIFILFFILTSFTFYIFGGVNTNSTLIFPELTSGATARAEAMSGAFTSVADDASAVYWNCAGLSLIKKIKISVSFDKWFMDSFYTNLISAFPSGPGAIGINLFYMNHGAFNRVNDSGYLTGGSISPYNISLLAGYGMAFGKEFSAGMALRVAIVSIETYSYSGFGADLGVLYKTQLLSAGVTIKNIGSVGAYAMPLLIRVGGSFDVLKTREHKILVSADVDYIMKDVPSISAGVEYSFDKIFSLRGGYKLRFAENNTGSISGFSAGAGFAINNLNIDYAFVPFGELGFTHRVTLNMEFSMAEDEVEMVRRGKRIPENNDEQKKITKTPAELLAMLEEAGTYENSGNLALAEKKYNEIIDFDTNYADAWKRLGAVMVKRKKIAEAYRCFEYYLKLKPDDKAVRGWMEKNSKE